MEFSFEAKVVLTLEHKKESAKSKHISTDFNLEVPGGLDRKKYLDNDNLPTQEGSKILSNVLVQGLVGNIHMAHEKGFRDSAEHLRWIISELERGFVTVVDVEQSNFKDKVVHIDEFPQNLFCPIGRKSLAGNSLLQFEAPKVFPPGWQVTDFDKEQRLVEVEDNTGEKNWLVLPLLFRQINFTKPVIITQIDAPSISATFHSVGSTPAKNGESLFLIFEINKQE